MATVYQNLGQRLDAAKKLVHQGICEDALPILTGALKDSPLGAEEEAEIRCLFSEALDILARPDKALSAVSKYESSKTLNLLQPRTQVRVLARIGRAWDKLRDQPKAIGYLNTALKLAEQSADKEGIGLVYLAMGRAYRVMNESTIATDCLDRAIQQFRMAGNRRGLAYTYEELAKVALQEGDYESAIGHYNSAETVIRDSPDYFLLGAVYSDTAVVRILQKNNAVATEKLEKAYDFFTNAKHNRMIAHVCSNLGLCLLQSGEWVRAETVLMQALEISRPYGDARVIAIILDNLAGLLTLQGRTGEAAKLLEEGFALVLPLDVRWDEIQLRFTFTRLHLVEKDFEKAAQSSQACVELAERVADPQFLARAKLFQAEVDIALGRFAQASQMLGEVETALQNLANLPELGIARRLRGELCRHAKRYEEAKQSLQQSLSIFETLRDQYQVGRSNFHLARLYAEAGDLDEARRGYRVALEIFQTLKAAPALEEARHQLESLDQGVPQATVFEQSEDELISGPLINRLVDAALNFDLLCTEIVSVTLEITGAPGAMLCRKKKEDATLDVQTFRGISDARKAGMLSALNNGLSSHLPTFHLCGRLEEPFVLVLDQESPLRPEIAHRLENVLMVMEQGLELTQLRTRTRTTKSSSPALVQQESAVPGFVHSSAAMTRLLDQIHKIRSSDVTVLITGESGTGKELIARAIHAESTRRQHRFVPFNCTATTKELVDSHLFGYRKGAFTGASTDSPGVIRAAENGTLFLDEIGDLALDVQPKLLRFLQEGEIQPLGEKEPVKVNVRVLAATNLDLEQKVGAGTFREDLFHRLNVIRLHIPPLRERREEIPLFVEHFLSLYSAETRKAGITVTQEAIDLMVLFDWPGNVRQLSNEIRRIVAMAETHSVLSPEMLSKEILQPSSLTASRVRELHFGAQASGIFVNPKQPLAQAVTQLEKEMLLDVLRRNHGNVSKAARELGMTRRGFYNKKQRLGID